MKKILVFVLILSLTLSSCVSIFYKASNNKLHVKIPNTVAEYQSATIHATFGGTTGPTVELQGTFTVFEYEDEDIQYARYITDLNGSLS